MRRSAQTVGSGPAGHRSVGRVRVRGRSPRSGVPGAPAGGWEGRRAAVRATVTVGACGSWRDGWVHVQDGGSNGDASSGSSAAIGWSDRSRRSPGRTTEQVIAAGIGRMARRIRGGWRRCSLVDGWGGAALGLESVQRRCRSAADSCRRQANQRPELRLKTRQMAPKSLDVALRYRRPQAGVEVVSAAGRMRVVRSGERAGRGTCRT